MQINSLTLGDNNEFSYQIVSRERVRDWEYVQRHPAFVCRGLNLKIKEAEKGKREERKIDQDVIQDLKNKQKP